MPSAKRGRDGEIVSNTFHQLASSNTAVATATAMPVSGFNKLLVELKLQVLSYLLIFSRPINSLAHAVHAKNTLVPLAKTNKDLYTLAMEMYYWNDQFVAQVTKNAFGLQRYSFKYPTQRLLDGFRSTVKLSVTSIYVKENPRLVARDARDSLH
jgi:hypothetical protein